LGTLLQREKRWKEALTIYEEAIERLPSFAEAYMARGAVKHHLGDLAGAAEDLKQALTINPDLAKHLEGTAAMLDKRSCH
jgi:tetratricopeptide (TPR) repeat protein